MSPARAAILGSSLTPFLYPAFASLPGRSFARQVRCNSSATAPTDSEPPTPGSLIDPAADDYSLTPFTDRCVVSAIAGGGGHGCISFHHEKYIGEGWATGGDGGSGGNVYIQAVRGETSLHKLARRKLLKAGRGKNGQGKVQGGERGSDMLITVPVGTVVREINRHDPIAYLEKFHRELEANEEAKEKAKGEADEEADEEANGNDAAAWRRGKYLHDRWLLFPGAKPAEQLRIRFPKPPPPRRSHLAALEPAAPIWLDLDKHMDTPMLIAAGAVGGLGNPHFMTPEDKRPKFATRGLEGLKVVLQLELKILADLGLVGLPNAGKSTILRSLTNSRARVGDWAFTTLQPNVGTVVLDNHKGRPLVTSRNSQGKLRENFTIADVPGLIEGAHLDKGLGLGFLRHIERAAVLAFVIDLSAGDAVSALKLLWREVSEYETMREKQVNAETEHRTMTYRPGGQSEPNETEHKTVTYRPGGRPDKKAPYKWHDGLLLHPALTPLPYLPMSPISCKPWFVVATKADLPNTQGNYEVLCAYLNAISQGELPHPSSKQNTWKRSVQAVAISALNGEGVQAIPQLVMDLLED